MGFECQVFIKKDSQIAGCGGRWYYFLANGDRGFGGKSTKPRPYEQKFHLAIIEF